MVIQPTLHPMPQLRPAPSRPVSASASVTDTVEVQPPKTPRQLLWSGLETAQVMSGDSISGPLGAVLTRVQKEGVLEVLQGLRERGAELNPEKALKALLKQKPDWDTPVHVQFGGEDWQLKSLSDLKDASELVGAEPVKPAGPALQRLKQGSWSIERRVDWSSNAPATLLEAYSIVQHGPPMETHGQEVQIRPPAGHPLHESEMWADAEVLPAVDFFYGTGNPEGLENPALAEGLKSLQGEGLTLRCWGSTHGLGEREEQAFSWYASALKNNELKLLEHGTEVAQYSSFTPADIESIRGEHRQWKSLDEKLFLPAVQAGLLQESNLDDVVKEVARPVQGLSLEQRATSLLDLIKADKKQDFYDSRRLYDDLVDLALPGPVFEKEMARAQELTRAIGSDSTREAMEYLRQELPRQIPFEPARERTEKAFMKLVLSGTETKLAQKCLELARTQVDGSPFEARVEELTKLHARGSDEGLADDYRAVLENRRSGETLSEAMRPLLSLMDPLGRMGHAEMARDIYVFIRQGLEYGTLAGTEEELVQRFLQTLLLRDNVEEARASLSRVPTQTAPGSVQETSENVKVGGVVVKRKKKPKVAAYSPPRSTSWTNSKKSGLGRAGSVRRTGRTSSSP